MAGIFQQMMGQGGPSGPVMGPNTVVKLTPAGISKASDMDMDGDFGEVVNALNSHSSCPLRQLEQLTGIPLDRLKGIVNSNKYYIEVARVEHGSSY
jgi:hypothetical protein